MRPINYLLLSLVLIISLSSSTNGQTDTLHAKIELKSSVDKSTIPLNEKLTFTIQASWEGEQDRFTIWTALPTELEFFEIMESSSLNESIIEKGKTKSIKTFKHSLKPTQTGTGKIGAVGVNYVDNLTQDSSTLFTQPINVQITPATREKGSSYKFVLALAILLILIYVIFTTRRRVKRIKIPEEKQTEELHPAEQSLEEKTLKKLEGIAEQIKKGELKNFSTDIYKLLTNYLEAKYQIVTSGKTSNDIISSLSNLDLSSEKVIVLTKIFSTCDLIKYAGEKTEKEKCKDIAFQVEDFLEQNR